jgi:hypothetical protein
LENYKKTLYRLVYEGDEEKNMFSDMRIQSRAMNCRKKAILGEEREKFSLIFQRQRQ